MTRRSQFHQGARRGRAYPAEAGGINNGTISMGLHGKVIISVFSRNWVLCRAGASAAPGFPVRGEGSPRRMDWCGLMVLVKWTMEITNRFVLLLPVFNAPLGQWWGFPEEEAYLGPALGGRGRRAPRPLARWIAGSGWCRKGVPQPVKPTGTRRVGSNGAGRGFVWTWPRSNWDR